MFDGFAHRHIEANGHAIAFSIGGAGPPLLLLHGFPQNRFMWAHVAPLLARHHTVVCADLRGYGDSAKPTCEPGNANYAFRAFAADQMSLMHALGFDRFHLVGHDRGARTGHRLALDHPDALLSLTLMDIVPTWVMLMQTNRKVAHAYWHWYFLAQPEPFPERLIAADPDFFYETSLVGWGATRISDFDQNQMAEYRRTWRDPAAIHAMTSDYRAAATVDLAHDEADRQRGSKVTCPVLVIYGSAGVMAGLFDIPAEWRKLCTDMREASLPGGHFFVDQFPAETAELVLRFIAETST